MQRLSALNASLLNEIHQDAELMDEIDAAMRGRRSHAFLEGIDLDSSSLKKSFLSFAESGVVADDSDAGAYAEAIILRLGRPSFLIQNDTFVIPADQRVWNDRLRPSRLQRHANGDRRD